MMLPMADIAFAGHAVAAVMVPYSPDQSLMLQQQQQQQQRPHQLPMLQQVQQQMPQQMFQQQQMMMLTPVFVPMVQQQIQQPQQQMQQFMPLGSESSGPPSHDVSLDYQHRSSFSGSDVADGFNDMSMTKLCADRPSSEDEASTCTSCASRGSMCPSSRDIMYPSYADHAAIVCDCFALVQHQDWEGIQAHCSSTHSSDVEILMPDLGIKIQGAGAVSDFVAQLLTSIPDLSVDIHSITEDGPSSVKAEVAMTGTQAQLLIPIFPLDKRVQWLCSMQFDFDCEGKIQCFSVSFSLGPVSTLDTSANIEGMSQCSLALASTPSGSRLLQLAMEADGAGDDARVLLIDQLRGRIWEVAASPHGNHVLQKFIASVPPQSFQFIIDELVGRAVAAAEHQKRCRILERLLEHCPGSMTAGLVEELLPKVSSLARHPFGNFVVQHILEHGTPENRESVVITLCEDAGRFARHKIASNVVRAALMHTQSQDRARLVQALAPDHQELMNLSKHKVGSFVSREIKFLSKKHDA